MGRKASVKDPAIFKAAVTPEMTKITVLVISPESVMADKDFLDARWTNVSTMKGTQSVHQVAAIVSYAISYSQAAGEKKTDHYFCKTNSAVK